MKFFNTLLISLIFIAFAACGSGSEEKIDHIAQLEAAVDSSRYDEAVKIIDEQFVTSVIDTMDATRLARLSIVYMRLRDAIDRSDNQGWAQRAAQIYGRAIAADSIVASEFYKNVPAERVENVQIMRQLYYAPEQHKQLEATSNWDEEHQH